MYKNVSIIYFSGTGGTSRITDAFEEGLLNRECEVTKIPLDLSKLNLHTEKQSQNHDLIILIFAVHAFDAPKPVYDWITSTEIKRTDTAVISVSGAGETWPNTGCRNDCCKCLEDRGFKVVYEKMMVMPSNWTITVNDHLAMWIINSIPEKVGKVLDSLLSGNIRRTNYKKSPLRSYFSKSEKDHASLFPKEIVVSESCTGCGWCSRNCPMNNISIKDFRPDFKDQCMSYLP
mgnify:CR=1 FL=1